MEQIRKRAAELLTSQAVQVVIGHGVGLNDSRRALFVRHPEQTGQLIVDDRCQQNLAFYLLKPEIRKMGKAALIATLPEWRTVIQLAAENQLSEDQVKVLGVAADGRLIDFATFRQIEEAIAASDLELPTTDKERLEIIEKMSASERWSFWQKQLEPCFKCYACRAACPLCYCTVCTVECNQPQWIPVPAHALGNLEWHIMRAMHLAGRCVNCGACARACPLKIPLNLLTMKLGEEIKRLYGLRAGSAVKQEYVLSTFRPDDKDTFIG